MKYFAIIPARGGSKGIKNKNIQPIGGKPMIQFTFEAAINSRKIEKTILSSDDDKIVKLAKKNGIVIPFIRPQSLAQDNSTTIDVIKHSLEWYKSEYNSYPENIVLLQPTSPFRTAGDLDNAIRTFEKSGKGSLISACEVSQHPSECFIQTENLKLELIKIKTESKGAGRQNYKKAFFIDGAIYISEINRFIETGSLFDEDSAMHILPKSHSIDIDDLFDLSLARAIEKYAKEENNEIFNF